MSQKAMMGWGFNSTWQRLWTRARGLLTRLDEAADCWQTAARSEQLQKRISLCDGVSVRDAPQHHPLDDGPVLILRQAAVRHQGGGQLGGRGRVHALQPVAALDLIQAGPFLRVSLQHLSN